MPFDLSKESVEGYCKVYDGVYVVSEYHRPGFSELMPRLTNRGFIFEANNKKNGKHLMMSGIPGDECIAKVQAIERDTGLKLKKIITSGDFHHMSMKAWLDAYPETQFVHSSLKFPTTRNGVDLLANAEYKARIELVEGPKFPALEEEYGDILEFYGFNQFLVYDDQKNSYMAKDKSKPLKEGVFSMMSKMSKLETTERFLAIWFYHKPSKELVIEHNFDVCFSKAQIAQSKSFMMRMMFKSNQFKSCAMAPMPSGPKDYEACKKHCEQMQPILGLDVLSILDYHTDLTEHIRVYKNKEEFVREFRGILKKTGEDDATGETLFIKKNMGWFGSKPKIPASKNVVDVSTHEA